MYIAMNRFRVKPDCVDAFKQRWLKRDSYLQSVPGFISFQLLQGPSEDDYILFASHTVWDSHTAFTNWTMSDAFRQAHTHTGQHPPLTLGKPVFEGFDVLQHVSSS